MVCSRPLRGMLAGQTDAASALQRKHKLRVARQIPKDQSNPGHWRFQCENKAEHRQGAEARRMKPLRASERRPPPPSVRVAWAEFEVPNFAPSLSPRRRPKSSSRPRLPYPAYNMSFAGRRRGNKVKKGVQFTVMVVGQYFRSHPCASSASAHCYLGVLDASAWYACSPFILQVLLVPAARRS